MPGNEGVGAALIYVRQSRHRDYERTASPEVQRKACLELAAVVNCPSVEVMEDLDVSGGGTKRRTGYLALLQRIKAGSVTVVAAYDQSRTFRNTTDALEFYALIEKHPEIEVVFVHGRVDRSPAGEFTYTTLAAAHAMERRMTAEKMRDAVRYRAGKGEMVGQVPAGYQRDESGRITIDEPTAELVRGIFRDYAAGTSSVRQIARRLNERGQLLPSAKTAWRGDTIAQLLANVAYIGKTYSLNRRHHRGALIDGQWEAIIDTETWDAVRHVMAMRRNSGRALTRSGPNRYVFEKLLRCSCGRRMHAQTTKETRYYRCPGTDALNPCRHIVREDRLIPWAGDLFARLQRCQKDDFGESVNAERPARLANAATLASIDARIKRLGQRFEWGHIDEAGYRVAWDELQAARKQLTDVKQRRQRIRLAGVLDAWQAGDAVSKRDLLGTLFDEIDVHGGQIVAVKPRGDLLAEVSELIDRAYENPPQVGSESLLGVGREGVEPPKLSRRFYRPLGSPRALCRPSAK
jgi:DNA invertase Pin-like site-specific DNA recombinase